MNFKLVLCAVYTAFSLMAITAGLITGIPQVMQKVGLNVGMGPADPVAGFFIVLIGIFLAGFAYYTFRNR